MSTAFVVVGVAALAIVGYAIHNDSLKQRDSKITLDLTHGGLLANPNTLDRARTFYALRGNPPPSVFT